MKKRKIPQRMCVGCQKKTDKKNLIRVVKTPEGEVLIDSTGKKSGRGAYLCCNVDCFSQAIKSKALQKALNSDAVESLIDELKRYYRDD